ncbi:MAG: PIN domain-containing protein [Acidobacteriota bacterium]|nr:PIN domain-containing protein [Acidobacteriota bacterium]
MIFLDTSAIYAWADTADANHETAVRRLQRILEADEILLTHNYVLVEAMALLHARLGFGAATKLSKDATTFRVEWVDSDLHTAGVQELSRSRKRRVSLVDHISFLVMRRRHLRTAFAFDTDFVAGGFKLFEN